MESARIICLVFSFVTVGTAAGQLETKVKGVAPYIQERYTPRITFNPATLPLSPLTFSPPTRPVNFNPCQIHYATTANRPHQVGSRKPSKDQIILEFRPTSHTLPVENLQHLLEEWAAQKGLKPSQIKISPAFPSNTDILPRAEIGNPDGCFPGYVWNKYWKCCVINFSDNTDIPVIDP